VPSFRMPECLSVEDGAESLSRNFGNRPSFHSHNTPVEFYIIRTAHFVMKLYNDQRNALAFSLFYLSIFFCLACFGFSFSPFSEARLQLRQWFKSPGYGVSPRVRMEV
jgi:hypothetical protein